MHNSLPVMVSRHNLLEIMASYSDSKEAGIQVARDYRDCFFERKKKKKKGMWRGWEEKWGGKGGRGMVGRRNGKKMAR